MGLPSPPSSSGIWTVRVPVKKLGLPAQQLPSGWFVMATPIVSSKPASRLPALRKV